MNTKNKGDLIVELAVEVMNLTFKIEERKLNAQFSSVGLLQKKLKQKIGIGGHSKQIKRIATLETRSLIEHHTNKDGEIDKRAYIEALKKVAARIARAGNF